MTVLRALGGLLLLVSASLDVSAQSRDWHTQNHDLFAKSAFAHGYMHGYEEGFHSGDVDMQMGRAFRDVKSHERYKKPFGYKREYGEKKLFESGYRHGFAVAYTDCFWGRKFRGVQLVRRQTNLQKTDYAANRVFDHAFKEGYESGQKQGLKDGRLSISGGGTPMQCDQPTDKRKGGSDDAGNNYCDAFRSGYELGYSDGFNNQQDTDEVIAKK